MTPEELSSAVAERPFWYHRIELPGGVTTPGWAPLSATAYRIPEDLTGKRVLDIGAWDGFWSFEALKRGAVEVVAIDDFSDYLGRLETRDRNAWDTFDLCRDAFGYSEKKCSRIEMSVYDLDPDLVGTFDVVFFFGTLYHLRHPLLALDRIAAICSGSLHIESAICDDFSPYRGGIGKGYPDRQMVMEFYPTTQLANNATNWWAPTLQCLMALTSAAGFSEIKGWKLVPNPTELPLCRGFVSAGHASASIQGPKGIQP